MLILPAGHHYRILLPQRPFEWRSPSAAQPKDALGRENCVRHSVVARTSDGLPYWRGWFEDREALDAFLWALGTGSLQRETPLWRLPTPWWDGGLGDLPLQYAVSTFVFKTTPTGSNQTSTSPSDWDNSSNAIETLGAGASGGAFRSASARCSGGGGGAWNGLGSYLALGASFSFATPGTTTYTWQAGTGGTAAASSGAGTNGTLGGDSWFNATTLAGSSCGSKGGSPGTTSTVTATAGTGGVGASGIGTSSHNGGDGGACGNGGASGGGGAAGANAVGGSSVEAGNNGSAGGQGDGSSGGAGGLANGNNPGIAGTEWDASHGSGGGGGGNRQNATATAGSGGLYGGGGGGTIVNSGISGTATSGAGVGGLVALIYTPFTAGRPSARFMMLGNFGFQVSSVGLN